MKEVFIFGAGASCASAGTPLGKDLVWAYPKSFPWPKRDGNNKRDPGDLKELEDLRIFIESMEKKFPGIKELFRLKQSIQNGVMYDPQITKEYYIDEILKVLFDKGDVENIKLIKKLILNHIASVDGQNSLYKEFVKKLKGRSPDEVSIISFNFDGLLCEDPDNDIYFNYYIDFNGEEENREGYKKGNIPFLKLHGSLDWAWDSNTNKMSLLDWYNILPAFQPSNNEIPQKQPYIFLPHQRRDALMYPLWEKAKEELSQAEKITIIGYSFPKYDQEEVLKLFNDIDLKVEWEVVDWAQDDLEKQNIKNKYRELSSKSGSKINVRPDNFKFDGFSKYMEGN